MATKITLKKKIVYKGREYASADELPDDVRRAYEQALANSNGGSHPSSSAAAATKITVNGQDFGSWQELPAEVRQVYESVLKMGANGTSSTADVPQRGEQGSIPAPLTPESSNSRLVLALIGLAVLLCLAYLLVMEP